MAALSNSPLPNIHILQKSQNKLSSYFTNLLNFKIIFTIIILAIIVEIIIGVRMFLAPSPAADVQALANARLALVTPKQDYQPGEIIPVEVRLSTGGYTVEGSDVLIKFDPGYLELAETESINYGEIFTDYQNIKNPQNGEVQISALNSADFLGFNGTYEFATLSLRAKKSGTTTVNIQFSPGSTADSNVIETMDKKDILGSVYKLDLNIAENASQKNQGLGQSSCDGFIQRCLTDEGVEGVQECEGGRASQNSCVWDPNKTIYCGYCSIE